MAVRRCICPCGQEIPPGSKSKYAHPATCRPRFNKLKQAAGGLTPRERKQLLDRERKRQARAHARLNGGPVPSDDRISFARAVQAVADWMLCSGRVDPGVAELEARDVLARARPKR